MKTLDHMNIPIRTGGNSKPFITNHSENICTGNGHDWTKGWFSCDIEDFDSENKTEITITIEPQPNGTFVTRYAAKTITP